MDPNKPFWEQMTDKEQVEADQYFEDKVYDETDPAYDVLVLQMLSDWSRCDRWKVLPDAGGIDDQNPFWLECQDIISEEVTSYQAELYKDKGL